MRQNGLNGLELRQEELLLLPPPRLPTDFYQVYRGSRYPKCTSNGHQAVPMVAGSGVTPCGVFPVVTQQLNISHLTEVSKCVFFSLRLVRPNAFCIPGAPGPGEGKDSSLKGTGELT